MKQQLDLEVKNFFDLLASTSSIKAKKQLLAERRDDGNVKKYLDYLLNPFFVTGISEKKIRKVMSVERPIQFHSFYELMAYVRKNHTGSDDILASVQAYLSMISKCLDRMIAEGKEGLMLNRNCKYFTRRHNGILKVKQFYTVDLEIVDLEEGTGRLSGTLGAFVVRYKNNYLRVGSGMTDDQRKKFWDDGLNLIGRVIEVKYKDESYDRRTGLRSLQFPTFVQLRELGKQESYD